MRVTLAASVLMLALATPAQGADKYAWSFARSGQECRCPTASRNPKPSSSFPDAGQSASRVVSNVLPRRPKKGQSVRTTLSNGAAIAAYDGKFGYTSSEEGFYFEASVAAEPKVVAILKAGTSLTISIPGKQERVPLRGVARPLAQF